MMPFVHDPVLRAARRYAPDQDSAYAPMASSGGMLA
jgi:hypothetical protein